MLNNIFLKIVRFMRYVEKYGRAGQTTDDKNKAHTRYLLGT